MSAPHEPCPRGCGRLSRIPKRYRAKAALCFECYALTRRAHDSKWGLLRSKRPEAHIHTDDIPPAEIERRYQLALAEIRRRHACAPSTPRS
jgi:hypothetical protein